MCQDCGCEQGNARAYFEKSSHSHDHADHDHIHLPLPVSGFQGKEVHIHIHLTNESANHHPHAHAHHHDHKASTKTTTIPLETKILAKNDDAAAANRRVLAQQGVAAINLISSPGTGKTLLLEKTLEKMDGKVKCGVIAGDQKTDYDAQRLEGKGAPVFQIETESACHLNAEQVGQHLQDVIDPDTRLLFIENVGNLVCPAAFDLGETVKVALVSVTEGEDKPLKYPVLFHDAPVTIITKMDLLPHLDVDLDRLRASIKQVRPDSHIFEVSAKTGTGMDAWVAYLTDLASGKPG